MILAALRAVADVPNPADCPNRQCPYYSGGTGTAVGFILLVVAVVVIALVIFAVVRHRRRRRGPPPPPPA